VAPHRTHTVSSTVEALRLKAIDRKEIKPLGSYSDRASGNWVTCGMQCIDALPGQAAELSK
jgi:hypothetical protein